MQEAPIPSGGHVPVTTAVVGEKPSETVIDVGKASRFLMLTVDPMFRKLPYEQRTAVLLNLLVTYAAEQPAALLRRGAFIKAMVEEFKKRLQMFLPLNGDPNDH